MITKFVLSSLVGLLSSSLYAFPDYYSIHCKSDSMRQIGSSNLVESIFQFNAFDNEDGTITAKDVIGHVRIVQGPEDKEIGYYSHFGFDSLTSNIKYKPRTYKNHFQFKNFDSTVDNGFDGGFMGGYFVVSKDIETENFDAHYIFQSGDHIGGTIDYVCDKR